MPMTAIGRRLSTDATGACAPTGSRIRLAAYSTQSGHSQEVPLPAKIDKIDPARQAAKRTREVRGVTKANQLIVRLSNYLEDPQRGGHSHYESWIADAEEENPGISAALRQAALELLNSSEGAVLRSAIQALACVGTNDDAGPLNELAEHADEPISSEASSALTRIALRHTPIEALLEAVSDGESFVRFTEALAKERELAAKLERDDPTRYCLDGALGWKNADIASFLHAGLLCLGSSTRPAEATWKTFADFLYYGKVVE